MPAADFIEVYANALAPDHLPLVTLGPFVITEYKTDELMIMRRNPYYWKVDEAGNQLPYLDEIQYRKGPSGIGRDLPLRLVRFKLVRVFKGPSQLLNIRLIRQTVKIERMNLFDFAREIGVNFKPIQIADDE